ncbi:MAG: Glyceraldehyde-3-phosphate dehydrogenase, partial [Parcubacteria group bacterium GW2011_GWC2_52_8c]
MTNIAINGFGRIGRSFFRAAFGDSDFNIVAVNDLTDTATLAYLLKFDSVYGRYQKDVKVGDEALIVDGKEIRVLAEKDPAKLPWAD